MGAPEAVNAGVSEVSPPRAPARAGEPSLILEDVHVTYRVYEERKPTLRQVIARGFRTRTYRDIHAVRGVSLVAHVGEAIGVIGRNGSGKSTLLQAIAGLLPVDRGAVYTRSEPAFLGVGAALQPKLSGRRNIMLGGLALGLSRAEIDARMDEIVEFAGLGRSIDLPLKTYSSGMRARLHFALASAVVPDVLLIDETLSVGDKEFQKRSKERIRQLTDGAGTVFIVSHSMKAITDMCERAIWLDEGRIIADGPAEEIAKAYEAAE
jgi:teichoic acid transport system ATP-binding protein